MQPAVVLFSIVISLLWVIGSVRAQEPSAPATDLKTLSPGVYRLGAVTFDRPARQVRFPAVVNQTEGPVEYLLVGQHGKTHESVLRTDVSPTQVHTAMLLLGIQPLLDKAGAGAPKSRLAPSAIDADYLSSAPLPVGVPVSLVVRWPSGDNQSPTDHPAETLIDNSESKAPMSTGFWLYNGSLIVEGRFQAELEKSFVAVITDPSALMNNPRPGHNDESIWAAATARLPKVGTTVELIIQLPPATP